MVLIVLAVFLLGVHSFLVPLAVLVIANVFVQSAVALQTFVIWHEHKK